jgi:peptidoglycan hydrolase-like protein with peptidoglycan-binding domain
MRRQVTMFLGGLALLLWAGGVSAQNQNMQSHNQQSNWSEQQSMSSEQRMGAELTVGPATIAQVQQCLKNAGQQVEAVDGVWSPSTSQALRAYQQDNGLVPTGNLDIRTLAKLDSGMSSEQAGAWQNQSGQSMGQSSQGQENQRYRYGRGGTDAGSQPLFAGPETVREVQQALSAKGLDTGGSDGYWGNDTEQAITRFQQPNALDMPLNRESGGSSGNMNQQQKRMSPGQQSSSNQQGSQMQGSHMQGSHMQGSYMQGSQMQGSHMQGSQMQGSHMQGSHMQGSQMQGSHMQGSTQRSRMNQSSENQAPGSTVPLYISPAGVRAVQQSLQKQGFRQVTTDGNWNDQTRSAIRQFQQQKGLAVTGNLDLETLASLGVAHSLHDLAQMTRSGQSKS